MHAIGDRAMEWKDGKRIGKKNEIFERDAALFGRHVFGAEEAGTGGDDFRVGVGERRATPRRVHLDDNRVIARGQQFSLEMLERRFTVSERWPSGALLI